MLSDLVDSLLASAREKHGWNQAELAVNAGIRPETMSRLKGGCNFDTLERLARSVGRKIVSIPDDDHVQQVLTGGGFSFDDFGEDR